MFLQVTERSPMNLPSERHGDFVVIDVQENRLDASCVVTFKDQIRLAVNDHSGRVLLDMSAVEFIDSSGLGALVGVMKTLDGRKLELANVGEAVLKVFQLTKMDRVFVLHGSRADALASRTAA
jgi:anti-sigma B factor antagonist